MAFVSLSCFKLSVFSGKNVDECCLTNNISYNRFPHDLDFHFDGRKSGTNSVHELLSYLIKWYIRNFTGSIIFMICHDLFHTFTEFTDTY